MKWNENTINPRQKSEWTFRYNGIYCRVCRWQDVIDLKDEYRRNAPVWNYYITLLESQIPDEYRSDIILPRVEVGIEGYPRTGYHYMSTPIADLQWHGGITFYNIEGFESDRTGRRIEMGCDFNHSWDEGCSYDEDYVAGVCRQTVDALWERFPNLMLSCQWDGKMYHRSELRKDKRGYLWSNEGISKRKEQNPTWADIELEDGVLWDVKLQDSKTLANGVESNPL